MVNRILIVTTLVLLAAIAFTPMPTSGTKIETLRRSYGMDPRLTITVTGNVSCTDTDHSPEPR